MRARAAFADAPAPTRAQLRLRQALAPLDQVEHLVPGAGRVLEQGCGHGLLALHLALGSEARTVHGVDVDPARVADGVRAAESAGVAERVRLERVEVDWRPTARAYDAAVICDVLYLLPFDAACTMVRNACDALRPGGTLVVKEVAELPRWKHAAAVAQEFLAVRVLRYTRGATLNPRPMDAAAAVLDQRGWERTTVPLHRGYPYSHVAVVARSPS